MTGTAKVRRTEAALSGPIPRVSEWSSPNVRSLRVGDDDARWGLVALGACARISFIVLSWPDLGARDPEVESRFPLLGHGHGPTRRIFLSLQITKNGLDAVAARSAGWP